MTKVAWTYLKLTFTGVLIQQGQLLIKKRNMLNFKMIFKHMKLHIYNKICKLFLLKILLK